MLGKKEEMYTKYPIVVKKTQNIHFSQIKLILQAIAGPWKNWNHTSKYGTQGSKIETMTYKKVHGANGIPKYL